MEKEKIKRGIEMIIEGVGEHLDREGMQKTPERFAKMCEEIFSGYKSEPPELSVFESQTAQSMIIIREIPFYSMCEHHLLPFFGNMHLAYIPDRQRVIGFSDIVQVIRYFSNRMQIQERLTRQVADYIAEHLQPEGLILISHATQLCMSMRGVKIQNARTEVVSYLGTMKNDGALRQEALNLLQAKK